MNMRRIGDVAARIAEVQEKAQRKAKREPLPGTPLPKNVVQLPLWPQPVRAVPNGFLRSALFGAIAKGRRRYMDKELVAAVDGVETAIPASDSTRATLMCGRTYCMQYAHRSLAANAALRLMPYSNSWARPTPAKTEPP